MSIIPRLRSNYPAALIWRADRGQSWLMQPGKRICELVLMSFRPSEIWQKNHFITLSCAVARPSAGLCNRQYTALPHFSSMCFVIWALNLLLHDWQEVGGRHSPNRLTACQHGKHLGEGLSFVLAVFPAVLHEATKIRFPYENCKPVSGKRWWKLCNS